MIYLQNIFGHVNSFITANLPLNSSSLDKKLEASDKPQAKATLGESIAKKEAAVIEATALAELLKKTKEATKEIVSHSSASAMSLTPTASLQAPKPQISTLVISTSLRGGSRSRKLALKVQEKVKALQLPCDFLDMKDYPNLPLCDGKLCYANATVKELSKKIAKASNIILAFPIYNYGVNGAAKNLIDLTGDAWEDKVVGFIATAGSPVSFMSSHDLSLKLMINSNCLIIPKVVFADMKEFPEKTETLSVEMDERIEILASTSTKLAAALAL